MSPRADRNALRKVDSNDFESVVRQRDEARVEASGMFDALQEQGAEVERLREALSVLPPYLKAAMAGDEGAIPLALDIIKAALDG